MAVLKLPDTVAGAVCGECRRDLLRFLIAIGESGTVALLPSRLIRLIRLFLSPDSSLFY